jgi:hypothetical protein
MSTQVIAVPAASHTSPPNVGTLCCCERPDCKGTTACYREFAASESGWRVIAERRPRWVLANGQAV